MAETRRCLYPLWLLCGDEIPWVQDGSRDSVAQRREIQDTIRATLVASGRPVVELTGSVEERLAKALAAIGEVMAN